MKRRPCCGCCASGGYDNQEFVIPRVARNPVQNPRPRLALETMVKKQANNSNVRGSGSDKARTQRTKGTNATKPKRENRPAEKPKKSYPCAVCGSSEHSFKICDKYLANPDKYCGFCGKTGHAFDSCPKIKCKLCNQEGHGERNCKRNVCMKCGKTGHDKSVCNAMTPDAWEQMKKAIKHAPHLKEALEEQLQDWKEEDDTHFEFFGVDEIEKDVAEGFVPNPKFAIMENVHLNTSTDEPDLLDQMYPNMTPEEREKVLKRCTQVAKGLLTNSKFEDNDEFKLDVDLHEYLESLYKGIKMEDKLELLLQQEKLPAHIIEESAKIPLYNPQWDGNTNCPIRQRLMPAPKANLEQVKAYAMLHFYLAGYSSKALQQALAKVNLWLLRSKVEDLSPEIVDEAVEIIWATYKSRAQVGTFWERVQLFIYDWWQDFLERPSTWFAGSALLGLLGLGVSWKFGAVASGWIMLGVTVASWCVHWLYKQYLKRNTTIVEEDCKTLEDYCTGTDHVETTIDSRARVTVCPVTECTPVEFQVGFTIAPGAVWIPRLCAHNELNALQYRQLLPALGTPESRDKCWKLGMQALLESLPPMEVPAMMLSEEGFDKFLSKYPTNRRTQIRAAFTRVNESFHLKECNTGAFTKREWLVAKIFSKRNPRLVSGKTDEYLAETGPEYWGWMKMMCAQYWPDVETALQHKFIYTGGMTGDQIGAIFSYYVQRGWDVIEGDYSRYDGHNEVEALVAEMGYYRKVMTPETVEMLTRQLRTSGKTKHGHKFNCVGKVASGVINTSFGNTIRGFMIVAGYCKMYEIEDFCVMQLGDDNVIFVEDIKYFDLERFTAYALDCGHKLEAIHRADPEFAEYCSQRFWNVGDTFVLGPKPARVLAKTFLCHDRSLMESDMPGYCQQVAVGFQHYTWVPVLGPVLRNLASNGAKVSNRVKAVMSREAAAQYHKVTLRTALDVDLNSVYTQFEKIYGFDPKPLEEELLHKNITFGKAWHNNLLDACAVVDGVHNGVDNYWGSLVPSFL